MQQQIAHHKAVKPSESTTVKINHNCKANLAIIAFQHDIQTTGCRRLEPKITPFFYLHAKGNC